MGGAFFRTLTYPPRFERTLFAGELPTIREVIAAFRPASLHLHLPGKTGEVLAALGLVPALRLALPEKTVVVLHTLPHYVPLATQVDHRQRPDRVEAIELAPMAHSFADTVAVTAFDHGFPGFGVFGDELHVCLNRTHPHFLHGGAVSHPPFIGAFADAVGVHRAAWEPPAWVPTASGTSALALPTANAHSSKRRRLPLYPADWKALATVLRVRGLRPLATGHPSDGKPELPGWDWEDLSLIETVTVAVSAAFVVGHNSGITWTATLAGSGDVVMLDDAPHEPAVAALYDPVHMRPWIRPPRRLFYATGEDALTHGATHALAVAGHVDA